MMQNKILEALTPFPATPKMYQYIHAENKKKFLLEGNAVATQTGCINTSAEVAASTWLLPKQKSKV